MKTLRAILAERVAECEALEGQMDLAPEIVESMVEGTREWLIQPEMKFQFGFDPIGSLRGLASR